MKCASQRSSCRMLAAIALAWIIVQWLGTARAAAMPRHDPLNDLEIDQLRDTAQDPDQRLKLYIQFARVRLTAAEQAHTDPKITDRAQQMHDHLQDFVAVYDELNENVDTYADRRYDIRKILKTVIEADNEFQAKLRALKDSLGTVKASKDEFEFVLSDALEDVDSSVADHRQLLDEQEVAAKHKRLIKPPI